MNISPIAFADSLRIGSIDFIAPDEIKVLLDIEAPDSLSMNTGTPRSFPRINGYLIVPCDHGYLVGQVEWITIENSKFPKRKGLKDFGLIDLPYPLRKLRLNPLGKLIYKEKTAEDEDKYTFERGVDNYPSVGDPVLLPTQNQLKSIIESGENRRVKIGTSPLAGDADVMVDPDKLFGRHLAVLGNTGSGKSCSVAGLIRWSLESANKAAKGETPNARFIVLDPNGEYAKAFKDMENTRIFAVNPKDDIEQLQVPLWFWNSNEWTAFTQASAKAQNPLLKRALREIRSGGYVEVDNKDFELRRKLSTILIKMRSQNRSGDSYEGWKFGSKLQAFSIDFNNYSNLFPKYQDKLELLSNITQKVIDKYGRPFNKNNGSIGYSDFPLSVIDKLDIKIQLLLDEIGGVVYQSGPNEDIPLRFKGTEFANHIEELAAGETNPQFFDYLIMRINALLSDTRMQSICDDSEITLESWLASYIGDNNKQNKTITIIDLSLVPLEIVNIVTAVIARLTFESLQRYRKMYGVSLPTVMVMEEAHTFIKKYADDADNQNSSKICSQVFERIAREGRKFGLGLVLSSQRPSELSPTVLSQCNTFLLHRISNDKDQELVRKLVPDNLRGLLRDLPSLPSQQAILLGWASALPIMVKMNYLSEDKQPQSNDPDFWDVWTKTKEREVNWEEIADDWQQKDSDKDK